MFSKMKEKEWAVFPMAGYEQLILLLKNKNSFVEKITFIQVFLDFHHKNIQNK
jgi:hypothetical protein